MTAPVKHSMDPAPKYYGVGPHWIAHFTMLGQGGGNAPIMVAAPSSNPPSAATVPSGIPTGMVVATNTGTGVNTLTFDDAYWAVDDWKVSIDDINGATPTLGYLGQFSNLGAGVTGAGTNMTCVLTTYNSSFQALDIALNTPIRITIVFKKSYTGAAQ